MSSSRRVLQQPAYVLHHRPFRDSSQLVDILSPDAGRLALVARGSRSARSRWRGILRPFQPLRLSWVIRSDLGTLTGAEIDGRPYPLKGDALLAGYYVNELILNFLHRHDPQVEIFETYQMVIADLSNFSDPAPALRRFEIELLRLLGYALVFEHEAESHAALDAEQHYEYRVEQGPVRVARQSGERVFSGAQLQAIAAGKFDDSDVLRAAGRLLRPVIDHHLGGRELKSRKVLRELHRAKLGTARQESTQ